MKPKKHILKLEEDFSEIEIGLVRLNQAIPEHELFFHINNHNSFKFQRLADIKSEGYYYDYFFSRYQAYDPSTDTTFTFISNQSIFSIEKRPQNLLFVDELNIKYLLDTHPDVDYILTKSDLFVDFSLILLPENLVFPSQEFSLSSETELYHLIQYYE